MAISAGSSWKARREAMGKSLDQASSELRISRRYLSGMEEGEFGGWPERVFSTGFIRSYAKYLSEDAGPVLAEYERSIGSRVESDTAAQLRPGWIEREKERGNRRTTYTLAAGAVLLMGIIVAWVTLTTERRPLPAPASVPAPVAVPAPAENAAMTADNAVAGADNAARLADNAAAAPGFAPSGTPGTAPALSVKPPGAAPAASGPSVAAVGGGGPLTGPFQLFLEASEQTWLMYSFDGGDPIDVTLYAGDKISIQANKGISLKVGNAGGIAGTLNGKRLPPFGQHGQVRKFSVGQ